MTARAADLPAQRLAAAFAGQVARWSRDLGAPDAAVAAARDAAWQVSLATSLGHVCIDLADLAFAAAANVDADAPPADDDDAVDAFSSATAPIDVPALRELLLASRVVSVPGAPGALPLILDAGGRIYLHRYFDHERRLAQRLASMQSTPTRTCGPEVLALLRESFDAGARHGVDWQQLAVAHALTRALTIVSGGPGTGKTSMLVQLLACLAAQDPACRIALCAPTGKAAARMQDAIRDHAARLPDALRSRLPDSASTVHRLLGARPGGAGFRHDAQHPLPVDVLVVDEASMLDLSLAARLVDALPAHARLVLCGDKDQLAAVEAGAVFAELAADPTLSMACRDTLAGLVGIDSAAIVPPPPAAPRALPDSVIWLTRNFRFAADSGIGRLAVDINAGAAEAVLDALAANVAADVEWIDDTGASLSGFVIERIEAGYAEYVAAVASASPGPEGVAAAFAAFDRFRVLCAERAGPRGADGINRALAYRLGARLGGKRRANDDPWFHGRPVLVLANDYTAGLHNGDVGLALPDLDGALQVWFADEPGGYRAIAPVRLPPHESAFATTVHKAQGSEFDAVLVVLPAAVRRVVTRELLYTALTRSRRRVILAGGAEVIASGIRNPTRRASGLAARLAEAAVAVALKRH